MLKLILITIIFLFSLLTIFTAPTNLLWYVSILVTEFSWIFACAVIILLAWRSGAKKYASLSSILGFVCLALLAIPIIGAWRTSKQIKAVFLKKDMSNNKAATTEPFHFWQMITGIHTKQLPYKTFTYDASRTLTLDYYAAVSPGKKPCVMVVHGGSWAAGDSRQLPELNTELAKKGYNVATINYRLAPQFKYPAPIENVKAALAYLRLHASELSIDTNNFVLLGRSAGAQIALSAAYTLNDASIKAVISFYGPADMVWGYANPTNPLVLNSKKVMEDYLGGTYKEVPQQYIQSSPTETVKKNAPPTLLLHGENDPLVSHLHDVRLSKKLDSVGVEHYAIYFPWATHGFDWTLNGPAGQLSTWCVMQFLKLEMMPK